MPRTIGHAISCRQAVLVSLDAYLRQRDQSFPTRAYMDRIQQLHRNQLQLPELAASYNAFSQCGVLQLQQFSGCIARDAVGLLIAADATDSGKQ